MSTQDLQAVAGAITLTDFDEIREVLRSPAFVQGAYKHSTSDFMRDCMTMLDGKRHMERRRLVGQLFSTQSLAEYRKEHLHPVIARALQEVAADRGPDGVVRADLVPLVWRMLNRMAGAITGIDGLEEPGATERFIQQLRGIGEALTVDWSTRDFDEVLQAGLRAREDFSREFFQPSFDRRRALVDQVKAGEIAMEDLPRDLLTLMIAHWDPSWDAELPLRESSVFLIAATQTTAQAFPPFILRLEQWLREHPEDRALVGDDDTFLSQAAFESLRASVAAPARIRLATEDVELASGRRIQKGERVALYFIPANQDPRHFGDDAADYNPHRQAEGTPLYGLAFGGGAHACIGRPLVTGAGSRSQDEGTMVSIARELYRVGLELDPDGPPVEDAGTHYFQFASVPVLLTRL